MNFGLAFSQDQVATATARMMDFVRAVLEPDALYELRPVPYAGTGSIWAKPAEFEQHIPALMAWNQAMSNPYFSINIRKDVGARKGIDSLPGSLIFADFDSGLSLADARAKAAEAGLPAPTAIVCTSAEHWHFYWRLDQRLPDLDTHNDLQRGLVQALGTCPGVCSHQQVNRLPGPFCNVKPDRPDHPRVQIVECDPTRVYPASIFPKAPPLPVCRVVPLAQMAVTIERGSLSDASRALIETQTLFPDSGRRVSLFRAARDMGARGWNLEDATDVLVAVGAELGLEPEDIRDIPRQVRNAFEMPSNPGYAAAEVASVDLESLRPRAVESDEPYDQDLEALPLPLPPSLPPRPAIALSHGVIGEFMSRVELETEAHPVALGMQFLVAFGNCIGRNPHAVVGRTRHGVNLFGLVVGNTGRGRKGTGGDIVVDAVGFADPYWAGHCRSPNLVSGEGVIDALRDRIEIYKPVKNGAPGEFESVVVDPGVEDKRLIIVCPEFVAALNASKRENATLSQTLREAWDGKTLRTMAKNSARTATDPHLSIVGHVTRQELLRAMREADIYGGLFNRFIFVLSDRARELPHGGNLDDLGPMPQVVKKRIEDARTVGRMRRSEAADRLWEREYHRLTNVQGPEIIAAVLSRGEAQVLRLSMIMALAAGRATIEVDDLEAALDLWRYSEASARGVFNGGEDRVFTRALELIQAEPGVTRSAIHSKLGWRVPAPELVAALSRIKAAGLADCRAIKTGGRPAERWYPAPEAEADENEENSGTYPAFPDADRATADDQRAVATAGSL